MVSLNASTLHVGEGYRFSTIHKALEQAQTGDVIYVHGGEYEGPLHIRKSVRLIGKSRPVIRGNGKGNVVLIWAPDVTIQGFRIEGSGDNLDQEDSGILIHGPGARLIQNEIRDVLFGIYLKRAPGTLIRENIIIGKPLDLPRRGDLIRVWYSDDVIIEKNRTSKGRDLVLWFSKRLTIQDNIIEDGRYGLHFMFCDDAHIYHNRMVRNSVGAYLMYSYRLRLVSNVLAGNKGVGGYGVGLKDMHDALVEDNIIVDNRIGLFLENAQGKIIRNVIAYNLIGGRIFSSAQNNLFEKNTWLDNFETIDFQGNPESHRNTFKNNYWSVYTGYDTDGDGIGDIPFRLYRVFENMARQLPQLGFFRGTPVILAAELASRMFPVFQPEEILKDEEPRVSPELPPIWYRLKSNPFKWFILALTLLGCAGVLTVPFIRSARGNVTSTKRTRELRPMVFQENTHLGQFEGVSVAYGKHIALRDVSFRITQGQTLAIWGPNGAGKSTILKAILGLVPYTGSIRIGDLEVRGNARQVRAFIGYVPQEIRYYEDLSVRHLITFFAKLRGLSGEDVEMSIRHWELSSVERQHFKTLSGGLRQRVALAIATLGNPPLLLLDEPSSNLDIRAREEFYQLIHDIQARGTTVILSSHREEEVLRLAHAVVILQDGKVVQEGPPEILAGGLQKQTRLLLMVPLDYIEHAQKVLQDEGFSVKRDGRLLHVDVIPERRVEVFRVCFTKDIPITNFYVEERS